MTRDARKLLLAAPAAVFLFVLVVLPYLSIVVMSFRVPSTTAAYAPGFTANNYFKAITDELYLGALYDTLRIALTVTVICLLLAYPGGVPPGAHEIALAGRAVRAGAVAAAGRRGDPILRLDRAAGEQRHREPGTTKLGPAAHAADVQRVRRDPGAGAHLSALHGAAAGRRHPGHRPKAGGSRAVPGRQPGQRVPQGAAAAFPARHPVRHHPGVSAGVRGVRDADAAGAGRVHTTTTTVVQLLEQFLWPFGAALALVLAVVGLFSVWIYARLSARWMRGLA